MIANIIKVFEKYQSEKKIGNVYRIKEKSATETIDTQDFEVFIVAPGMYSYTQTTFCGRPFNKEYSKEKKFKFLLKEIYWELTDISEGTCDNFACMAYDDTVINLDDYYIWVGDLNGN